MAATARKPTNWFAIWTSIIVAVIVIGVGAAVVIGNNAANPTYDLTAEVNEETGAVSVGAGEKETTTYIDFMCPACNQFEQTYSSQMLKLASEGKMKVAYVPVNALDGLSQGTNYSSRAGNALYCVADANPKAVVKFIDEMFKEQPREGSTGLTDEKIISIAKGAGADIATCQTEAMYTERVTKNLTSMPVDPTTGRGATPTVVVDGQYVPLGDVYASRTFFTDLVGESK